MPKLLRCPSCTFARSWVLRRGHRKCKACKREWSPRAQTLEKSFRLREGLWQRAVSTFLYERTIKAVLRETRVSYMTAQKIVTLLRTEMTADVPSVLSGTCEADETYFGGLWRNLPTKKRRALAGTKGRKTTKQGFLGMVSRDTGQALVIPIPNAKRTTLIPLIAAVVTKGSTLYTDGWWAYRDLPKAGYVHDFVDHEQDEYVRGDVHTQTIEGLWGFMKRRMKAIGGIRPSRLPLYVGEQLWRYNFRHLTHDEQVERLLSFLTRIGGRK